MDMRDVFPMSGTLGSCINDILMSKKVNKGYGDINELVGDDKRCVEFMNKQLLDDCFQVEDEKSDVYELSQKRAAHSVLTYFMGMLLKPFGGIFDKIKNGDELWIRTSMYHDYGYFSSFITKSDVNLKKITNGRYLLTDDDLCNGMIDPSNSYLEELAYSYWQLEHYFEYSRVYHFKNDGKEKVDHGILGGALIFSRLTAKLIKNSNFDEIIRLKKFCLAIAQHNIFKMQEDVIQNYKNSMKNERIKGYENCLGDISEEDIHQLNSVKIDEKTPLLLFLSLVDTIECFKKFGRRENQDHSFNTATVLNNIGFSLKEDEIKLDFSDLSIQAHKDGMSRSIWFEDTFEKYKNNIEGFDDWTIFKGVCDGYKLSIKLDRIL